MKFTLKKDIKLFAQRINSKREFTTCCGGVAWCEVVVAGLLRVHIRYIEEESTVEIRY